MKITFFPVLETSLVGLQCNRLTTDIVPKCVEISEEVLVANITRNLMRINLPSHFTFETLHETATQASYLHLPFNLRNPSMTQFTIFKYQQDKNVNYVKFHFCNLCNNRGYRIHLFPLNPPPAPLWNILCCHRLCELCYEAFSTLPSHTLPCTPFKFR